MIKIFYQEDIINRLAAIITYGYNKGYSYKSIEEYIVYSPFVIGLENNQYDIESKIETVIELTYQVKSVKKEEADISFKGLFLAESYFNLFLTYNRSFEYLFLYLPLEYLIDRYNVYHEMDFSNLKKDFEKMVKKTTLIKKIAVDRGIKLTEISKLTGINGNTIDRYARDDKYLYGASQQTIYRLSILFGVKENIFVSNLGVYLDQSIYLPSKSNKRYRDYLGYYFANYYDQRISEKKFHYNEDNGYFYSSDGVKIVVISDTISNIDMNHLKTISNKDTYIIIIPYGFFGDETCFYHLKDLVSLDVFILTHEFVYIVKKDYKKEITDTVNRSLIIRARETK